MTTADIPDVGTKDLAARLRDLLSQIEDAVTAPRSDPRAQQQLALCAEIESILQQRSSARTSA